MRRRSKLQKLPCWRSASAQHPEPSIATYISSGDGLDVPPADLGSAAAEDAGPTAVGGFFSSTGGAVAVGNTAQGLGYLRSTSQVLAILFGALTTAGTAVVPASSGTNSALLPQGSEWQHQHCLSQEDLLEPVRDTVTAINHDSIFSHNSQDY